MDTSDIIDIETNALKMLQDHPVPTIVSKNDYVFAGDLLKSFKDRVKSIENIRLEFTQPLTQQIKLIKSRFDKAAEPVNVAIKMISDEMIEWYTAEKIRVDKAQAKLDKKAEAEAGVDGVLVPIINDIKTNRGDIASTTVRMLPRWRVTNFVKVPRKYLCVDEKLMTELRLSGDKAPLGIEFFSEPSISSR